MEIHEFLLNDISNIAYTMTFHRNFTVIELIYERAYIAHELNTLYGVFWRNLIEFMNFLLCEFFSRFGKQLTR